jgi:hypothetical protein
MRTTRKSTARNDQVTSELERRQRFQQLQQQGVRTTMTAAAELHIGDVIAWPDDTAVTVLDKKDGSQAGMTLLTMDIPDGTAEVDSDQKCFLRYDGQNPADQASQRGRRGRR